MKLNAEMAGTGKVFGFTFRQLMKMKSNRVLLIISLLLALASTPVMSLINGKKSAGQADEPADFAIEETVLKDQGYSESEIQLILGDHYSSSNRWEDFEKHETQDDGSDSYSESGQMIQTAFSAVLLMVSVMSISYIIRAVVEEKASKLVDLLLVSVRPMALLLGKVLAVLVYIILYFALILVGAVISSKVSGLFMDTAGAASLLAMFDLKLDAAGIAVLLVTWLLGFMGYGVLSGMCGAGCSTMEESGGAMSTCMLLIMVGYMLSIAGGGFTNEIKARLFALIPGISPYALPVLYMQGKVGLGIVGLSWLIQLIVIGGLIWLAAQVYSSLVIYNGQPKKFMAILRMAFGKEGGKK